MPGLSMVPVEEEEEETEKEEEAEDEQEQKGGGERGCFYVSWRMDRYTHVTSRYRHTTYNRLKISRKKGSKQEYG